MKMLVYTKDPLSYEVIDKRINDDDGIVYKENIYIG